MIDSPQRTLQDYLRVLRSNRVAIVLVTIVCAGIGAGLALSQKPSYVAVASVTFQDETLSEAEAGLAPFQLQTAAQIAAQGASTILGPAVLSRVRSRLHTSLPITTLRTMLATSVDASSALVSVAATAMHAKFAAKLADEVAASAVKVKTTVERGQFAATAAQVQRQYIALRAQGNPGHRSDLALASLLGRYATLQTLAGNARPASLAQSATVPAGPSSPRPIRSTGFGALIGLILGLGLAFVRDTLDRRLRDSGEIQEMLSLPVVGRVRAEAMGNAAYVGNGGGQMTDQDIESFRVLRANIEVLDLDGPPKSILVTSPLPQEGKSTVAASLAAANAAAGKRTLLLECDLRRPCLSDRMSIDRSPGLSDYLAGQATPAEVLQVVALSDAAVPNGNGAGGAGVPLSADTETGQLVAISAGTRSARPAELLASERFRTFLQEITAAYDTVVIDTSPLLSASDALELVPLADCVLLCIRSDQTTSDQARAVKEVLERQPGRTTGVVVTGMKRAREHDYGYYSGSYYGEAEAPTSPSVSLPPRSLPEAEIGAPVVLDAASELPGLPDLRRWRSSRVVARLAGVNVAVLLAALMTGSITARTLGVSGRGDLAAIIAVLTIGPWLLDIGQTLWLGRERARGVGREELLGAALPVAFACSLIAVAAAIPLSHALGHGRPVVTTFLEIGLFSMPLSVILQTLAGLATGESRWGLVIANSLASSFLPAVTIVVLAVLRLLTVASAAAAYLIGSLVGSLLFLKVVRGMRRLVFERWRVVAASRFGVKSWLSTVSATATNRLDQVLMAGLVSSRVLGLYAVAVTVASVTNGIIGAVSGAQYPRVAEGDGGIVARSSRVTMAIVGCVALMLAAASPWLMPVVFGSAFKDAVPMAIVLLVASVPMAGAFVLSSALTAANNPGSALRAELVALAFTLPALIAFLRDYGGLLAAIVSLIAYTIRLSLQLVPARRTFSTSCRTFLLPTREDLIWIKDRVRLVTAR